jgi:hypothetical protein
MEDLLLGRTKGTTPKTVCRIRHKHYGISPERIDHRILNFRNPSVGWSIAAFYKKPARGESKMAMIRRMIGEPEPQMEEVNYDEVLGLEDLLPESEVRKLMSIYCVSWDEDDPQEQLMFYNSLCVREMLINKGINPWDPGIRDFIQGMFEMAKRDGEVIWEYLEDGENVKRLQGMCVHE